MLDSNRWMLSSMQVAALEEAAVLAAAAVEVPVEVEAQAAVEAPVAAEPVRDLTGSYIAIAPWKKHAHSSVTASTKVKTGNGVLEAVAALVAVLEEVLTSLVTEPTSLPGLLMLEQISLALEPTLALELSMLEPKLQPIWLGLEPTLVLALPMQVPTQLQTSLALESTLEQVLLMLQPKLLPTWLALELTLLLALSTVDNKSWMAVSMLEPKRPSRWARLWGSSTVVNASGVADASWTTKKRSEAGDYAKDILTIANKKIDFHQLHGS
jgi:hypothetical protein